MSPKRQTVYEIGFFDQGGKEIPGPTGFRPLESDQPREMQFFAMAQELGPNTEYRTRLLKPAEVEVIGATALSGVIDKATKQQAISDDMAVMQEIFRELKIVENTV